MTTVPVETIDSVESLHRTCNESAQRFRAEQDGQIESYRRLISEGIDTALAELRAEMSELSGGNEVAQRVGEQLAEYVGWMQWSLWDIPVLAVALEPDPDDFRDAVTACGLVYIAIRAFDDVIDEHFNYKGRHDTFLGTVSATYSETRQARGLSTLAGLLLCFDGLGRLAAQRDVRAAATVTNVLSSLKRAVIGAIMECTPQPEWTHDAYVRMVRLKNVDYWRALYTALDREHSSPLYPFLAQYYELAQYLNDVEDYDDDIRRGQPNLLSLRNETAHCRPVDDSRPWAVTAEIETMLADRVFSLAATARELPVLERSVAETKLADLLEGARAIGLFAGDAPEDEPPPAAAAVRGLFAFSELPEVIEQVGTAGIVDVGCAACGSSGRRELFRKQGFRFQRCTSCTHVYVSPRVTAEAQRLVVDSFDGGGRPDKYLEVQRIYAEHICDLLRRRTPGPRLLDVGFGRGYLLQMSQVYGFEAFGVDESAGRVDALRPLFGPRVEQVVMGRDPVPWDSFDVVVMSHVLEHLPDPARTLQDVGSIMNPAGWLYVAVPDIGSMDFKIFGKNWDVVNPLVHLQYFSERSLSLALESAGFEQITRIRHPHLRDEVSPRWMRLMRQLGGTESSELTMIARLPDDPANFPPETAD
jgi:SAM-dependent methyltransferase